MSRQSASSTVATIGIDIGKNTFHLVGLDQRGNIVFQLKTSREQLGRRLANVPRCLASGLGSLFGRTPHRPDNSKRFARGHEYQPKIAPHAA